uniref:SEC22 homolog B, vesicle trafficking protein a n=1 Tax=Esox lucius TaxID=8010 RepID=A0A6Q2Y3U4_ESOLU
MVLLTMIARVADGLPLAASMQDDEQSGRDLQHYQSQAKQLCRKLNAQSPNRCTLEAGVMSFHYIIEHGVCYLALCEAVFPKKLVFAYLEELQNEFNELHGKKVPIVSRPYSFIEFDMYIQKTKKHYVDSRTRRNLGSINTELQGVQRIMVANIEEVLQRGEALSGKEILQRGEALFGKEVLQRGEASSGKEVLQRGEASHPRDETQNADVPQNQKLLTPKPAIFPAFRRSTAATPSTSTSDPPMPR